MFKCPSDHKHEIVSTCYIAHRCRCEPCRAGFTARRQAYAAGARSSINWTHAAEEVEHFVSLGETGLICQQLFAGRAIDDIRRGFERSGRPDVYDMIKDYIGSEAWA